MVLYSCLTEPVTSGQAEDCSGSEMDSNCRSLWIAWAVGGGITTYPPVAGLPFGASPDNDSMHFVLEVFYCVFKNLLFIIF